MTAKDIASPAPLMTGKKGLVMGVANDRSIAWGIARVLAGQGAKLAFTYQGESFGRRAVPLAESVGAEIIESCDVEDVSTVDNVFKVIEDKWGGIDFVVHALAFSDRTELRGHYADTSRENFVQTMIISCFSFTEVCRRAAPLMTDGGSLLTLTYGGASRVLPCYNVMGVAKAGLEASVRYLAADLGNQGIRVNAVSAGPVKTLAASGIGDFRYILKWNEYNSPLRRNVSLDQVGGAALYLLSDLSSGVTGAVHHVDSGYHTVGMMAVEAAPRIRDLLDGFKSQG